MGSPVSRIDAQAEVPDQTFGDRFIDFDFHIDPLENKLLSYMEDNVIRDKLTTELDPTPIIGEWDAAYGIKKGSEGLFTRGRTEYAKDAHGACERLAVGDPIVSAGISDLPLQHHPILKNGTVQVGNDYILDNPANERAYTSMLALKQGTEHAVEEAECVASEDSIVATYSWSDPKTPWGSEQLEPVFKTLVKHDLPPLLHGSLTYWSQRSYVDDETLTWTEILGFNWPVHAMVSIVNMIM